jgi:protocatechuate 3,4-dioxygenase beta subunit
MYLVDSLSFNRAIIENYFLIVKLTCMQRRSFIKNTALCAVAVSASGFIRFDGNHYVGDCETTTDILGPFYRPGSPVRNNLVIKGEPGSPVELSGIIKHKDCITPYKKAKIELWHCSSDGVYDNTSDEYRYRGTVYCDDKGRYSFNTILPVPYNIGAGISRPAHFHLMITAEGYQPLVTQLYFTGDPNIAKDVSSASPTAKRRILDVQTSKDGTKKVLFDVSMSDKLAAEPAAMKKLAGVYVDEKDKANTVGLFIKNKILWVKNNVFGENLEYIGNNTFQFAGLPTGMSQTLLFELMANSTVKLTMTSVDEKGEKQTSVFIKGT